MRLTEKIDGNYCWSENAINHSNKVNDLITDKLGKLEDAEEELNIDLLDYLRCLEPNTLFRIMPYEKAKIIDDFRRKFTNEKET